MLTFDEYKQGRELLDLNRARAYIVDLARRNNITLYGNVVEAVLATVGLVQEFSSTPIHVQKARELAPTLVQKKAVSYTHLTLPTIYPV